MNTRNIQTFLMVSATFFAMSVPVRSNAASAGALSHAVTRAAQSAPARSSAQRDSRQSRSDEEEQNS
ncbi:hypothetical protein AAGS40_14065 [Paraburkholderia sp. PREW-6R]|uniref:hypothetical protein n=1 Tax=Paraburkholderia sp. PREW-6R TaxID=3141544 RepID=UPI0031F4CE93